MNTVLRIQFSKFVNTRQRWKLLDNLVRRIFDFIASGFELVKNVVFTVNLKYLLQQDFFENLL